MTDMDRSSQIASAGDSVPKRKRLGGDNPPSGRELYLFIVIFTWPFLWVLFSTFYVGQPITITSVLTVFLPFIVLLPLLLFVRRERLRNTLRSETGFCSDCGHEIPPGERSRNCQECGSVHTLVHDNKTRLRKTPGLFWSELLFIILFPVAMMAPTFTLGPDGIFGSLRNLGFNPYPYLSSSSLVATAESDWQGESHVWNELQSQTLTADQLQRLADTVLAYREDPELSFFCGRPAATWFSSEIARGTLTTPTLIRILASSLRHADTSSTAAFDVLATRTLTSGEQAALLEILFTNLEDPERRLGFYDHTLEAWFAGQLVAGNLTHAQLERARACNWIPELVVPERLRVDEPFEVILGAGERFGSSGSLLAERWTTIAVSGVAIDDGPFEALDFEPVLVLYSGSPTVFADRDDPKERLFPIELVIDEPGPHVIRIRYQLFDGQRSQQLPSVERAADGSLVLPEGAGWILERVFEHPVVVEAD
jgi:hypothetical protein